MTAFIYSLFFMRLNATYVRAYINLIYIFKYLENGVRNENSGYTCKIKCKSCEHSLFPVGAAARIQTFSNVSSQK